MFCLALLLVTSVGEFVMVIFMFVSSRVFVYLVFVHMLDLNKTAHGFSTSLQLTSVDFVTDTL